jgi:hypothetical protein
MEIVIPKGGDPAAKNRAIQRIIELPSTKAYRINFNEDRRTRSQQQNAYYWGVVLATLSDTNGGTPEDWHRMMLCRVLGHEVIEMGPFGLMRVPKRTTTRGYHGEACKMNTMQFMAYVDQIRALAAEYDCYIPDPDPEYWNHEAD